MYYIFYGWINRPSMDQWKDLCIYCGCCLVVSSTAFYLAVRRRAADWQLCGLYSLLSILGYLMINTWHRNYCFLWWRLKSDLKYLILTKPFPLLLQGSSKHFIPHSAITCSVQTEDIVACVLLLYNPATRCPLHVHAYRCDSEATAEALNQQLQILINRPENQKRFADLESR